MPPDILGNLDGLGSLGNLDGLGSLGGKDGIVTNL